MKTRRGLTLIEMIVAIFLSSLVLLAIVGVAAQMIRFQMEGTTKSGVAGWTMISLDQMNRELQDATALYCPSAGPGYGCGSTTSSYLSGCKNYSLMPPGSRISPDLSVPITAFYYCVDNNLHNLLRYQMQGACPYAPQPTCGQGSYTLVAQKVYPDPGDPQCNQCFRRADDVGGVELNFNVGDPINPPQSGMKNPVYMKVQTKIGMKKPYNDPYD